jgi:hypothetical protein
MTYYGKKVPTMKGHEVTRVVNTPYGHDHIFYIPENGKTIMRQIVYKGPNRGGLNKKPPQVFKRFKSTVDAIKELNQR